MPAPTPSGPRSADAPRRRSRPTGPGGRRLRHRVNPDPRRARALRFRGAVEWTRFDALFGTDGKTTAPLGVALSSYLDVDALPLLDPAQTAAQTLARAPSLQLAVGTLRTLADSRIATIPISLEY